jgi:fatty acid desaturase
VRALAELEEQIRKEREKRMQAERARRMARPLGEKIRDALVLLAAGAALIGTAAVCGLASLLLILVWPLTLLACVWMIARALG